jgi:3-hydroxyacyl-CoA dehydrogenase / enoyl-CoA hydratase / 3-hydroxybutyryl-CoA epimerase
VQAFQDSNIRAALGGDGVLVATIDMPGRTMNVFSAPMMDSLDHLIDWVAATPQVRSVVLTSGKAAFIAGADLEMVRMFTERARHDAPSALHQLCGRLGRIFRRLELTPTPYVAAIQGLAFGGGLELTLACNQRVLADNGQVGVPEVKLGLLPGAGGTQRLPRLIGKRAALKMALLGEPEAAESALSLGIVDEVVPLDRLLAAAHRRALALAGTTAIAPWDQRGWRTSNELNDLTDAADVDAFVESLGVSAEQRRQYPAYDAILACVSGGFSLAMSAAGDWEMECFVELIRDPVAGNMVRSLFLDRQRAAKRLPAAGRRPRAAVLGADASAVANMLRTLRIEVVPSDAPDDAITLLTSGARSAPRESVAWLKAPTDSPGAVGVASGVWVSEPTTHGRAVEVSVEAAETDASLGLEFARWLRATPLVTQGGVLLPRLAAVDAAASTNSDERLLAVALEAARVWCAGVKFDTGIADSAAVIAGLHPPYTGGPFEYLRQRGAAAIRSAAAASHESNASLFQVPDRLDELAHALA